MRICAYSGHSFDLDRLPSRPRVLDVGARDFAFAQGILNIRPGAYVLALDPAPDVEGVPGVDFKRAALVGYWTELAPFPALAPFRTGGEAGCISVYGDIVVECLNIRDITSAPLGEEWDLVKLDCEASEFGILENWPLGGIAGQISVEFHDFKNSAKWNAAYFDWLWTQLPDYHLVQHPYFRQGEAMGHWDTLLVRNS